MYETIEHDKMQADWLNPNLTREQQELVQRLKDKLASIGLQFERYAHVDNEAGYYRPEDQQNVVCVLGCVDDGSFYCIVVRADSLSAIVSSDEAYVQGHDVNEFVKQLEPLVNYDLDQER